MVSSAIEISFGYVWIWGQQVHSCSLNHNSQYRFSKISSFVRNLAMMARNIIGVVYPHLDKNFEFQIYCPKNKNQFNIIWEFESLIISSFSNVTFYFFVQ